jgi:hypothetical protein
MRLILEYVRVRNPLFWASPPYTPQNMAGGEGAHNLPLLSHSFVALRNLFNSRGPPVHHRGSRGRGGTSSGDLSYRRVFVLRGLTAVNAWDSITSLFPGRPPPPLEMGPLFGTPVLETPGTEKS